MPSQQPRSGVVLENLGIPDIAAQRVDRAVAGDVHHLKIEAPRRAADVRNPARSDWPEKACGSSPTRSAWAFTMLATLRSVPRESTSRRVGISRPPEDRLLTVGAAGSEPSRKAKP
jgi:hypothetical protein